MLTVIDPTTGKLIREVEAADAEQAKIAIARADEAFGAWGRRSFDQRAQLLHAVATTMREDRERLAMLMTEEMGKPITEARGEVDKAAWCAEHYADHAAAYLATETLASDATHSYVQYLPLGVVLGILPWNAPFWLAFRFLAPTLMAGNTCLMKHDSHVPGCAQAIADVFEQVGAPDGLVVNLPLRSPDVEPVIRDERVKGVSLTGSDRAGSIVGGQAGEEIKPVVLELGGSDPAIVLADADLEAAADMVTTMRMINAGQSCIAAKRIIVEDAVHDEFVGMLTDRMGAFTMGDPRHESTQLGPIAREGLRDELHDQVRRSIEEGASCVLGGEIPEGEGFFYPPTVLTDTTPEMAASCEETFGPVAAVQRVADADEAVRVANDSPYGLGASVFTTRQRGEEMTREIVTGQVAVNGIVKTDPRLPSGGVKRSGVGRELGRHGIHEFVNAQQIWVGPKQD